MSNSLIQKINEQLNIINTYMNNLCSKNRQIIYLNLKNSQKLYKTL